MSYSQQDRTYVKSLVQALESYGLPIWMDDRIDYGEPWPAAIEKQLRECQALFGALKTRGFNLESTHFLNAERLDKLVALLALAFCWAMLSGLWQHQSRPIPLKTHGRKAKSFFRYGCDFLRRTFVDFSLRLADFNQALQLLSPY